jgi:nucleoid-associated protein YgaU
VKSLNLKSILKSLKLNESTISMVLGALVIIIVGVLVVNYFKDQGTGSIPFLSTGSKTEETGTTAQKTYTVQEGDNLWKIAEASYGSGYNWVDIAKENNLTNPSVISEGQKLTLPDVEPKTLTTTIQKDVGETISGGTYTVVRGDNLWDIAVRAYGDGYKWVEIARENNLVNPDLIHAGNILTLPR